MSQPHFADFKGSRTFEPSSDWLENAEDGVVFPSEEYVEWLEDQLLAARSIAVLAFVQLHSYWFDDPANDYYGAGENARRFLLAWVKGERQPEGYQEIYLADKLQEFWEGIVE
jgi:hypothetical protein